MKNDKLSDALQTMYEILRLSPNPEMLLIYKAAQAYADLPRKIRQLPIFINDETGEVTCKPDDVLNLLNDGV